MNAKPTTSLRRIVKPGIYSTPKTEKPLFRPSLLAWRRQQQTVLRQAPAL